MSKDDPSARKNFNEAYDIVGYGVGRLNLQKACTSEAFKKTTAEVVKKLQTIKTTDQNDTPSQELE
ncbi:MAG: hypothetical protein ACRBDI_05785 [Alphaproteobacteria bacterium]